MSKSNDIWIGTDGSVIQLLTSINKDGFATVKVLKVGRFLVLKPNVIIKDFRVKGGIVYFDEQ